jgi:hypothetical protein
MGGLVKTKSIDERIEELEALVNTLKTIKDTEPQNIQETICKKYVELGSCRSVVEYLNGVGQRYSIPKVSKAIDEADPNTNLYAGEAQRMLSNGREAYKHNSWR